MKKYLIAVVVVILVATSGYLTFFERGEQKEDLVKVATSTATTWQTISDVVNNLSFKYPESLSSACARLQQKPEVIATLVKDAKVGPDGCYPTLNGNIKRDNITLGGRDFCYSVSSDVGAGQLYYEYLYTTFKDAKYYTLRYVVHTSNGCGAYMNSNDPNSSDNGRYRECVSCQAKYDDVVIPLVKESVASLKFTN